MCRLGSNPCSLCFPGQEQPKPSSSGSRSILLLLHSNPGPSSEPKYGGALAPVPPLQAPLSLPLPRRRGGRSQFSPQKQLGGCVWGRGQACTPAVLSLMQLHGCICTLRHHCLHPPCSCRGDAGVTRGGGDTTTEQNPPHTHTPTHTHIPAALPFGVAVAGEFQLFQHLYLFWLQFLFWPHYKLKAALLLTSSKLHLLTSLPRLLAGRGLLLAGADALALEVCRKPASPFLFLFPPPPPSLLGTGCQQRLLAKGACHR